MYAEDPMLAPSPVPTSRRPIKQRSTRRANAAAGLLAPALAITAVACGGAVSTKVPANIRGNIAVKLNNNSDMNVIDISIVPRGTPFTEQTVTDSNVIRGTMGGGKSTNISLAPGAYDLQVHAVAPVFGQPKDQGAVFGEAQLTIDKPTEIDIGIGSTPSPPPGFVVQHIGLGPNKPSCGNRGAVCNPGPGACCDGLSCTGEGDAYNCT
jgi:hypothetical protein